MNVRKIVGLAIFLGLGLGACGSSEEKAQLEVLVFADWDGDGVRNAALEGGLQYTEVAVNEQAPVQTPTGGKVTLRLKAGRHVVRISKLLPRFEAISSTELAIDLKKKETRIVEFGLRPEVPTTNHAFKVVLHGDSITAGFTQNEDFSYSVDGYDLRLKDLLLTSQGRVAMTNRAVPGTKSPCGSNLMPSRLTGDVGILTCSCVPPGSPANIPEHPDTWDKEPFGPPGYVVVLYGTNDTNDPGSCINHQCERVFRGCETIGQLESMLDDIEAGGAIPILGTLTPGYKECKPEWNVNYNNSVVALNAEIRALAEERGLLLADFWKAFESDLTPGAEVLISDIHEYIMDNGKRRCGPGLHPSREGYQVMAEVVHRVITGQPSPYEKRLPKAMPMEEARQAYLDYLEQTDYDPRDDMPGFMLSPPTSP